MFTHIPGLKVVIPSTPYDAKGLLIQAIRDDDPVIFFEHKLLYGMPGDVPEESYAIPFGEATSCARAMTSRSSRSAAWSISPGGGGAAGRRGCRVRGHRPAHHSPLDKDTILESVEKTGRLVVVDEAYPRCNDRHRHRRRWSRRRLRLARAPIRW